MKSPAKPDSAQLTEIYSTYVTALLHSEGKRQNANQVYLTISLAIVTAYSTIDGFSKIYAAFMIGFVSLFWILTITFYRNLSRAKFSVVREIEQSLEYPAFTREWDMMPTAHRGIGLTRLEILAPIVLIGFAAVIYLTP